MAWLEAVPDDYWDQYQPILSSDECIRELNIELLFLVRSLILETRSYARVCKRTRVLVIDFQSALDARNIHRCLGQNDSGKKSEKETISILSLINRSDRLPSRTDGLQLAIHWLAINGEQPIIPENPLPSFIDENPVDKKQSKIDSKKIVPSQFIDQSLLLQKLFEMANSTETKNYETKDRVQSLTENNLIIQSTYSQNISGRCLHSSNGTSSSSFKASQSYFAHELSIEQQLYFKSLTESCFNGTNKERTDAFYYFSSDAALQPLLPRLLLFIAKGIQTNIRLHDPYFITQFLSILKMLTLNTFISFDKYLHSIIPSLLTCLVCIFDMPKPDNVLLTIDQINSNNNSMIWIVREQAGDLISYFASKYSTVPYFTERIISIIKSNLSVSDRITTYSSVYACIRTLLLIDVQMYGLFVVDIAQNCKKSNVLGGDFDCDHSEQQIVFNQKINELLEKYNLVSKDE